MAGFAGLLLAYVLGGLTLLPLLLAAVACHAYLTLPLALPSDRAIQDSTQPVSDERDAALEEKLARQPQEPDVAAAYFAVCREYVPGGVNGKPPERTSPAGQTIAAGSPSVYQSMYRSIFERGKTQAPTIEAGKPVKKARNVFFVVLRHGHLVLFDNSEQLEVRHVISLDHHDVDIYAGGHDIPEGELWIKRNCIRLAKKHTPASSDPSSAPFFLFSENCSDKEDFYHALINNQARATTQTDSAAPLPLAIPTEDMIKLIRQLHASEENSQTRWLNALFGRLFLALYKTSAVEQTMRQKITKKIARVAKPAFITNLRLEDIDMGDSGPFFFNPKLREMTVDGMLILEADVRYMGNFKAVIAAVAKIDLGARFKAREVNMILAGVLKRLEGHVLIKIKPPPSNRLWFSFENLPKLDISLEPIVSSRQITYGIILRAIQSRIREVFGETLVYPNWDDIPFTHTEHLDVRGGVWKEDRNDEAVADLGALDELHSPDDELEPKAAADTNRSNSLPVDANQAESAKVLQESKTPPLSPSLDPSASPDAKASPSIPEKPKAMRSNSFAAAANPVISKSPAMTDSVRRQARKGQRDATSAMRTLSKHSPEVSPTMPPTKVDMSAARKEQASQFSTAAANAAATGFDGEEAQRLTADVTASSSFEPLTPDSSSSKMRLRGKSMTEPAVDSKAKALNQSLSSATAAAKNWGWGMLSRQSERSAHEKTIPSEPVGRGKPLPPPGMPLPGPDKANWAVSPFSSLRRKPVAQDMSANSSRSATPSNGGAVGGAPERRQHQRAHSSGVEKDIVRLERKAHRRTESLDTEPDSILTVAAPQDSPPRTPEAQSHGMPDDALPDFDLGNAEADGEQRTTTLEEDLGRFRDP